MNNPTAAHVVEIVAINLLLVHLANPALKTRLAPVVQEISEATTKLQLTNEVAVQAIVNWVEQLKERVQNAQH